MDVTNGRQGEHGTRRVRATGGQAAGGRGRPYRRGSAEARDTWRVLGDEGAGPGDEGGRVAGARGGACGERGGATSRWFARGRGRIAAPRGAGLVLLR